MMDNYVERSFSRDRFQWAKCVCKYLHDAFLPDIIQFVVLLAEVSRNLFYLIFYDSPLLYFLTKIIE